MADRYWVNGDGNWSNIAHWDADSGGAGGDSVPNSSDRVFISGNELRITVDVEANFSTFSLAGGLYMVLNSNIVGGSMFMNSTGFDLVTNNYSITLDSFSNNCLGGTVDFGSSTVTVGTLLEFYSGTYGQTVYDADEANFVFTGNGQFGIYVGGLSVSMNNFTIKTGSSVSLLTSGNVSVNNLTLEVGANIYIYDGRYFTVGGTLTSIGSSSSHNRIYNMYGNVAYVSAPVTDIHYTDVKKITAQGDAIPFMDYSGKDMGGNTNWTFVSDPSISPSASISPSSSVSPSASPSLGPQFYLYKNGGVVNCDYLDISNSNAMAGATWYAGKHSLDTFSNDGWIFKNAPKWFDKYENKETGWEDKLSSKGTAWSDKHTSKGTTYTDKYGQKGTSWNDKYEKKDTTWEDKYTTHEGGTPCT